MITASGMAWAVAADRKIKDGGKGGGEDVIYSYWIEVAKCAAGLITAGKLIYDICGAAAAVLGAIQTLLQARRGLDMDALVRSPGNLRIIRRSFGLSQGELAGLLSIESGRGLVCSYESARSAARISVKRWKTLKATMGSREQAITLAGEADAAIATVAAAVARYQEINGCRG